MTAYLLWKTIHVIAATIVLGTGIGIAFFCWFGTRQALARGDIRALRAILHLTVIADAVFTAPAVVVQLVSGLALLSFLGWSAVSPWALAVFTLFVVVGACWLPVVWIQIQLDRIAHAVKTTAFLPPRFHSLLRAWFALGIPAFAGVVALVWLMVARPLAVN